MRENSKMSFEEYKREAERLLIQRVVEEEAKKSMILYEEDFPQFYEWNWSPLTTVSAIDMGV